MKIQILFLIALLCAATASFQSADAATITVTNTNNSGAGSLRGAIAAANDGDTIDFSITTPATITLLSELMVDKSVAITGPGAASLAVDGNGLDRVFHITSGKTVTISGLTITNGLTHVIGGGIWNDHATLTLSNCIVSGNWADFQGGGIFNGGATLTIQNSILSGNSTGGSGGGIFNGSATLTITNSTLSGNSAGVSGNGGGGGVFNSAEFGNATLTITNSTLSDNFAYDFGGGIENDGTVGIAALTIKSSTLSGNSSGGPGSTGKGGGILNAGSFGGNATLTIKKSTLSDNSAGEGGGINNTVFSGGSAPLEIGGTILKKGASGSNIFNAAGTVTSDGYNLSSDDGGGYLTGPGDQINTDPKLGPLQDNGGPTFTHLPASDSPTINAGDPTLGMDQRGPGYPRVVSGRIDIGAVEVQAMLTPVPAAPIATNATDVTNNSFTANWNSVSGATGYRLDVAKNSSFKGGSFVTGYHNLNMDNVTSRFVGGLNANTTYYYRVRAFNSIGVSPNSNVITVTTTP